MSSSLQVFNSDLIPVYTTDTGEKVVLGRELHEKLMSNERYSKWIERMATYGFDPEKDYTPYQNVHPQNNQWVNDHILSFDMAKEICMLQRTDVGRNIRKKLIDLENQVTRMNLDAKTLGLNEQALVAVTNVVLEHGEQIRRLSAEQAELRTVVTDTWESVKQTDKKLGEVKELLLRQRGEDWRNWCVRVVHKLRKVTGEDYWEIWERLYKRLNKEAHVNVHTRAKNHNLEKLDIIILDPKLKIIFNDMLEKQILDYSDQLTL